MTERLKVEQTTREESLSELSQALRETVKSFEKRAVQLDEQTSRAERELRQQLMDPSVRWRSLRKEPSDSHGSALPKAS